MVKKRGDHPRVNDKLAVTQPPSGDLVDARITELQEPRGHWAARVYRKSAVLLNGLGGSTKTAVGRGAGFLGDFVKARYGDNGELLRERLQGVEKDLAGPRNGENEREPTPASPAPMPHEPALIAFHERVDVVLYLTHLIPGVMSPGGWSHTVMLPIDRGREVLLFLKPLFGQGSGWEKTVSSCDGFITNIERASTELSCMGDNPRDLPQEELRVREAKVTQHLSEARSATSDLSRAMAKLADAARAYPPDATTA